MISSNILKQLSPIVGDVRVDAENKFYLTDNHIKTKYRLTIWYNYDAKQASVSGAAALVVQWFIWTPPDFQKKIFIYKNIFY